MAKANDEVRLFVDSDEMILRGPRRDDVSCRLLPLVARGFTDSHSIVSYQYRAPESRVWEWKIKILEVGALTIRDFARFWRATTFGPGIPFTYVHTNRQGVAPMTLESCRWVPRQLPITREYSGSHSIVLQFLTGTAPVDPELPDEGE